MFSELIEVEKGTGVSHSVMSDVLFSCDIGAVLRLMDAAGWV